MGIWLWANRRGPRIGFTRSMGCSFLILILVLVLLFFVTVLLL